MSKVRTKRRKCWGISTVEIGVVLAVVVLAAAIGAGYLSSGANESLETTADGVADPAQLADQFTGSP